LLKFNVSGFCVVALSRNLKLTTTLDRAITQNPCYVPLIYKTMKRIWNYRFYILTILGQIITWRNITDTWHNNTHFALALIGMVISFVGVALQLIIAPNFDAKCPDCNADLNCQNGKITFKKHST